ncbi:MAG: amino acid-binding protein, partial [Blautia sp.]|nr:amino acid-binding protein [Blautia sp.]
MLKQISIYAENRMGTFQRITELLFKEDINILGSVTNDSAEYGIIRMVVSDTEKALAALTKAGYMCKQTEVLGIEVKDEAGNLNKLLLAMKESNINADYLYLSFNRDSAMPIMVVHTPDIYEVEECLRGKG